MCKATSLLNFPYTRKHKAQKFTEKTYNSLSIKHGENVSTPQFRPLGGNFSAEKPASQNPELIRQISGEKIHF